MALFSERYGYTKPADVIIRERITPEVQNAICNCYDKLRNDFEVDNFFQDKCAYSILEQHLWVVFFNGRKSEFNYNKPLIIDYIIGESQWYEKLNLIEMSIKYMYESSEYKDFFAAFGFTNVFIAELNREFNRLNFAYRVINKEIAEITSEEEIIAIEEALSGSKDNIRTHLDDALKLYARKPNGDYRNSIKESISAVEAYCREKTGEDTLGKALNKLESSGIIMPKILKTAFDKLYAYTNHPDTGIRHALMDDEGSYVPQAEEALFMLVSCSAFINYLNKKQSKPV